MLTKLLAATALVAAANADTQNQCHQHTSEGVFFNLESLGNSIFYRTAGGDPNY